MYRSANESTNGVNIQLSNQDDIQLSKRYFALNQPSSD